MWHRWRILFHAKSKLLMITLIRNIKFKTTVFEIKPLLTNINHKFMFKHYMSIPQMPKTQLWVQGVRYLNVIAEVNVSANCDN